MIIDGAWDCEVSTPLGLQKSVLTFKTVDNTLAGEGVSATGDVAELRELKVDGDKVSWIASVEKPLKLDVKVEVVVVGDAAKGKAKLGMLGSSPVSMTRRA